MENPELYRANNDGQRQGVKKMLDQFPYSKFKRNTPNQRVLDIGCGPGDITVSILYPYLPADSQVVGADISAPMINYAKEKYRSSPQFEFHEYDFDCTDEDVKKNLGKFDKIFSFWAFHWARNPQVALQNIYDLLKPGGEIMFAFVPRNPHYDVYEKMVARPEWGKYLTESVSEKPINPYEFSYYPCAKIASLAKTIGFQDIQCTLESIPTEYSSSQYLQRTSESTNPFVGRIPTHLKESFLTEYHTQFIKCFTKSSEPDGNCIVVYEIITLYGSKR